MPPRSCLLFLRPAAQPEEEAGNRLRLALCVASRSCAAEARAATCITAASLPKSWPSCATPRRALFYSALFISWLFSRLGSAFRRRLRRNRRRFRPTAVASELMRHSRGSSKPCAGCCMPMGGKTIGWRVMRRAGIRRRRGVCWRQPSGGARKRKLVAAFFKYVRRCLALKW